MTRSEMVDQVRDRLRQFGDRPFDDSNIQRSLERGIDEICVRVPFCIALDQAGSVAGQREYLLQPDVLRVLEVYYQPGSYDKLNNAIDADDDTLILMGTFGSDSFPDSGAVRIDNEVIEYTSMDSTHLYGCTRGAAGTVASSHLAYAVVQDVSDSQVVLECRSANSLALADPEWSAAERATPTYCYMFSGLLGFDIPPDVDGYRNISCRVFVRPPQMASDSDEPEGLLVPFHNAVVTYAAYDLAMRLAQDDASQAQAARLYQDFISSVALLERTLNRQPPIPDSHMVPFDRRS